MLSTGIHLRAHLRDESSTSFLLIQQIRIFYQAEGTSLATRTRMMGSTSVNHGFSEFRKRFAPSGRRWTKWLQRLLSLRSFLPVNEKPYVVW
ncbi:hypothetical protein HID58_088910, partial [Brassica napus]